MNKGMLWAIIAVLGLAVAVLAVPAVVGIKELTYSRPFREVRDTLKADFPAYPGTKIVRQGKKGWGGTPMRAPSLCSRDRLFHYKEVVLDVGALREKGRIDPRDIHQFYARHLQSLGFRVSLGSYRGADGLVRFGPGSIVQGRDGLVIIEQRGPDTPEDLRAKKPYVTLIFFIYIGNLTGSAEI